MATRPATKKRRRRKKKNFPLIPLLFIFLCVFLGYHYDAVGSVKSFVVSIFSSDSTEAATTDSASGVDAPVTDTTTTVTNENSGDIFIFHFIDVGQGDAVLMQSLQGDHIENILVDAGEADYGKKVVTYLKDQGVSTLNAVVATHPHSDHIGGLPQVFSSMDVKSVYMPRYEYSTQTFENLVDAVQDEGLQAISTYAGMTIPMSGATITVLAPGMGETYMDINNYSIVLMVEVQGKRFLLTGDAETISEQEQLNAGYDLHADVLKVAHHGSSSSSSAAYIEAVHPTYAIISVGKDNEYGHPHDETLNTLSSMGCKILRTDESGTIVVRVKEGNYSVIEENTGGNAQ